MKAIHGGDIYRNQVEIDFSVNVNPLGIPERVVQALHESVAMCKTYPDIAAEDLKNAVAKMLNVPKEYLIFGNGASEIFMAIVHAVKPEKTVIPVPSFYGYEYAANASEGRIVFAEYGEELDEETDLLFLANPNNPTGTLLKKEELIALMEQCRKFNILVVLDECFIEFCDEKSSMLTELERYENLIIVRAFTKIFAIPGVRLGYMISADPALRQRIQKHLPEWNLSGFAETAGVVCACEREFIQRTRKVVERERRYLSEGLCGYGFSVKEGEGNFILFYTEQNLYDPLLERGILIRDCSNFRGLKKGFYRIAVKKREENERLLKVIGEVIEKNRTCTPA